MWSRFDKCIFLHSSNFVICGMIVYIVSQKPRPKKLISQNQILSLLSRIADLDTKHSKLKKSRTGNTAKNTFISCANNKKKSKQKHNNRSTTRQKQKINDTFMSVKHHKTHDDWKIINTEKLRRLCKLFIR